MTEKKTYKVGETYDAGSQCMVTRPDGSMREHNGEYVLDEPGTFVFGTAEITVKKSGKN